MCVFQYIHMYSESKINTVGKPVVSKFLVTQCFAVAIQPCMEWIPIEKKLAVDQKLPESWPESWPVD